MRAATSVFIACVVACGPARGPGANRTLLREKLSSAASFTHWTVVAPNVHGAFARTDGDAIALTVPAGSGDAIVVRRTLDVSHVRGQRLRLTVRVKTEGPMLSIAKAGLTIQTLAAAPSYRDVASTRSIHTEAWTSLQAAIDVAPDATLGQLDLTWAGAGTAWFSDIEIEELGPAPPPAPLPLSPQQISNLVSFTRAAALIQYLHPSDEAAALDWNALWPAAIQRILAVTSQAQLVATMREIFAPIAPTVSFGAASPPPERGEGTHLVRWHRYGFGVRAQAPMLSAKVVALIDGRAMSATETYLQMIHDHHLAVTVGEPSAGTNGNVTDVELPAGFTFRFTAMRVVDDAGWTLQGHGFTPDHLVQPTLDGVAAGRDEVLQAGVEIARKMIAR
ncbi:MAG TPA: S41 family peptidase [Kofleriaceae bacterium]|nr:S41 family peptidase [Kofleriaceae bacterium]